MEHRMILAGFGGQGVLSLGQLIAHAAIRENKNTTWFPAYGPEMRGGTCNCSVVVSDKRVASPMVNTPTIAIVMNKPALNKFEPKMKSGGVMIINSSLTSDKVTRTDITAIYIKMAEAAVEAGDKSNDAKSSNMVALGALIKHSGLFSADLMKTVIREKFKSKPEAAETNIRALEIGMKSC